MTTRAWGWTLDRSGCWTRQSLTVMLAVPSSHIKKFAKKNCSFNSIKIEPISFTIETCFGYLFWLMWTISQEILLGVFCFQISIHPWRNANGSTSFTSFEAIWVDWASIYILAFKGLPRNCQRCFNLTNKRTHPRTASWPTSSSHLDVPRLAFSSAQLTNHESYHLWFPTTFVN